MGLTVKHTFVSPKSEQTDITLVGPNEWNSTHSLVNNSKIIDAKDLIFQQTPGGVLTGGISNTITLTPVPLGVNGTDIGHYVYISGGTGTAEAVIITGGTAISGASSGTLTFTPANNHSGAWTINSATGGIQEALNLGYMIINIVDSPTIYGQVSIQNPVILQGSPGSLLTWSGGNVTVFLITSNNVTIKDCSFAISAGLAAVGTTTGNPTNLRLLNLTTTGGDFPINMLKGTDVLVRDCHITGFRGTGIATSLDNSVSYIRVIGNYVSSVGSTTLNGGCIGIGGSHTVISDNTLVMGGNSDQGIAVLGNSGAGLNDCVISNNTILVHGVNAFEAIGLGSCIDFVVSNNTITIDVTLTRAGFYGIEINQCANGLVSNNSINWNLSGTQFVGVIVLSSTHINVMGNFIRNQALDTGSNAIALVLTEVTDPQSGQLSYNQVLNNQIICDSDSILGAAITLTNLLVGNVLQNRISGNYIKGSTASGWTAILIVNNAIGGVGATSDRHSIDNNVIEHATIGINISPAPGASFNNLSIKNNTFTNVSTLMSDFGTATLILDNNGLPFSFLASQANGSVIYCNNGTITNPVTGGGTGCIAKRLNGVWVGN